MHLIKLSEERLKEVASQPNLQRAECYVGNFFDCDIAGGTLEGKIRGNHGEYDVRLRVDDNGKVTDYECQCDASKDEFCKHAAALGLTYIYSPWLFSGKRMKRSAIKTLDDLKYYMATTPLREMFIELKSGGLGLSDISEILKISVAQLSSVIRDDQSGKTHQLTEPVKLACMYLLEKEFSG